MQGKKRKKTKEERREKTDPLRFARPPNLGGGKLYKEIKEFREFNENSLNSLNSLFYPPKNGI